MSRCTIFFLALALICGTSQAGIRDWLDRADDLVRAFENFSLFPSRILYSILGTRRKYEAPLKRITAESSDRSDLITIIRSPHSPMDISNLRYNDETTGANGLQIFPARGILGRIGNRLSNRLDKVGEGISLRTGNVADKLTERASKRLDEVGDKVSEKLADGLSNGIDGITQKIVSGGLTSIGDRFGGIFGGKKDDKNVNDDSNSEPETESRTVGENPSTTKQATSNTKGQNNKEKDNGIYSSIKSIIG